MQADMRPTGPAPSRVSTLRAERFTLRSGREYIRFENGQIVRADRAAQAVPVRALTNGSPILRFPSVPYVSGRQRRKLAKAARVRAGRARDAREFNARLEQRRTARAEKHELREVA